MAQVPDKESQKKQIGDLLRNADRYIKSAEWNKAFEEVNKALAIEPNNMYAMAYKDRINVSLAEEKKKAEEEKVKKLSDDKKGNEKPPEEKAEKPKEPKESEKPAAAEKTADEPKKEPVPPDQKIPAKEETPAKGKDDSAARIESLRQEFASTQAKLQRDVAQLTMQLKEIQALKESSEKKLNAHIAELQKELLAAKQSPSDSVNPKELETLKEKHKKEVERAKEIAGADSLAQIAVLQKELEQAKKASDNASIEKQGEEILRYVFDQAWKDGTVTNDKRSVLEAVKFALKISDAKFAEVEKATKAEAYINALRKVWIDGAISTEESDFLQSLREKLGIPAEEHFKMESRVRKELKK